MDRNRRSTNLFTDLVAAKIRVYPLSIDILSDSEDTVYTSTSFIMEVFEVACTLRSVRTSRGILWFNSELKQMTFCWFGGFQGFSAKFQEGREEIRSS